MEKEQLHELLYQALETEQGGMQIYTTALACVQNEDLKKEKEEWEEYLAQDSATTSGSSWRRSRTRARPGRRRRRGARSSATSASRWSRRWRWRSPRARPRRRSSSRPSASCSRRRRTTSTGSCSASRGKKPKGDDGKALREAHEEVEDEEDEHLYHTTGWTRELWIQALGMPAVLPPPEEEKEVKTAIGAARAKQSRKEML